MLAVAPTPRLHSVPYLSNIRLDIWSIRIIPSKQLLE